MPRIFQNVSPFGDLVTLGRIVKHGETVTTYDDGIAAGLAEQPLNWLEVDVDGNPIPEPEPEPEIPAEPEQAPPAEVEPEPVVEPAPEPKVAEPDATETKSKK